MRFFWIVLILHHLCASYGWTFVSDRRAWLSQGMSILLASGDDPSHGTVTSESSSSSRIANSELPMALRSFTKLAPLQQQRQQQAGATTKTTHLSLDDLAARLTRDLALGATGHGSYIVTGDLGTDVFRDDCSFVDPTNRVDSVQQYQKALTILFDPNESYVDLLTPLQVNTKEHTISGTYRCRGTLKLPWHPVVQAFESEITYTVDPVTGLIVQQTQRWSKSASEALTESFTPGFFLPPPRSVRTRLEGEPAAVTELFDAVNGRRNTGYSQRERAEIGSLIEDIAAQKYAWRPEALPGKWMLVFLQPGTEGAGVDRRIPFPEFPFNDSIQVFGKRNDMFGTITNIGELFGPGLSVEVAGDLVEVLPQSSGLPKRLQANILGGKLCVRRNCLLDLPISGVGIFESVYLGDRLRIGQNINGGGARVVQVKLD